VLVKILCVYLAWQVRIVQQQKQLLAKIEAEAPLGSSRSTRLRSRTPYMSSEDRFNFRTAAGFIYSPTSGGPNRANHPLAIDNERR